MRKIILLLISMTFFFGCSQKPAYPEKFDLVIFSTNDMHGYALDLDNPKYITFDKLAAFIANFRTTHPTTLLLDAGDATQGFSFANLTQGTSVINLMNMVGYDAMTLGNHEFDFGMSNALKLRKEAHFPLLSNVQKGGKDMFSPYIIRSFNGVNVAIVGLTTPETAYKTNPKNIEGAVFEDPVLTMKRLMPVLTKKADIIIVLGHLGQEGLATSGRLAQEVPGITAILDGHDHTKAVTTINNTLIINTGYYSERVTKIILTVTNKKVSSSKSEFIEQQFFADNVTADPAVHEALQKILTDSRKILDEVVAEAPVGLDAPRDVVRTKEALIGQIIADAFRDETQADIGMINGGGIRTGIDQGPITKNEILSVLPFNNTVVTITITGQELQQALEHSVSVYPQANGGFIHWSGLIYTANPALPAGQRISNVLINGQPLNRDTTYTLATLSFIAAGGDGFDMLKKPLTGEYSTDADVVTKYLIEKKTTINWTFEPRSQWLS